MYKRLSKIGVATLGLALLGGVPFQASAQATDTKKAQSDNTRVNKRDRKTGEPTADQQKENVPDREVARKIRRAIVEDKSLSTYAHNVKVIVMHGKVTLKGPVHTEEEKKSIEAKASEVAGGGNVTNELTVKGDAGSMKHTKKSST